MSSAYQLHGISTRVAAVAGAGAGVGCIHVEAACEGLKSIGVWVGSEGRK